MFRKFFFTTFLLFFVQIVQASPDHRLGGGIHYWYVLDDIDVQNVDETGFAWMISYQYKSAILFKFEADLEILPEKFAGSTKQVFAPQIHALLGESLYAGVGVGLYYSDNEIWDDPFYNIRAGIDLELIPSLHLDINANYRFGDWEQIDNALDNADTDTITLSAIVRIEL